MPESLASDKHFGLYVPFISYVENEVLLFLPQGAYSQHFIFFVTYKLAK